MAHVILNSLYLFYRLLFGGIEMSHKGTEDNIAKQTVCSIAQDTAYADSYRRKLTPKHIGLGLALDQATSSEALVDLFHSANHTSGIHTTTAHSILEIFVKNCSVCTPDNIVKYPLFLWQH